MATTPAAQRAPREDVGPFGPPVPRPRAGALRAMVLDHQRSEPRRSFPALLHVGLPGGPETARPGREAADDHALRVEVLAAMLRRVGALSEPRGGADPAIWLTRTGPLALQDLDAAWASAARAVCAELAVAPVPLVVVTRAGWWEPDSGSGRRWRRLRRRP